LNPHPTRSLSQLRFTLRLIAAFGSQPALASPPPAIAGAQIALASGFQFPKGITIAKNATTHVADTQGNQVVTVSRAGVVTPISIPGYTLSGPVAVAVDSAGDIFIADSNNARVPKVSTAGTVSQVLGSHALSYPAALTFDPAGDLYIGDAVKLAIYCEPVGRQSWALAASLNFSQSSPAWTCSFSRSDCLFPVLAVAKRTRA
jgi:hypothetical protein